MSDTLLPENDNIDNTGRMSRELEIKFGNKEQTNEFNEIIIVKKNSLLFISLQFFFLICSIHFFWSFIFNEFFFI